jgi:hypothetical protein
VKKESLEALGAVPITLTVPTVVHQGKYRLYEKPDGTLRVQYQRDDRDEEDYFELPGPMVALAKAASEGKLNPMQMMQQAMKYMRGNGA